MTTTAERFEQLTPEFDTAYGPGYTAAVRSSFEELPTEEARTLFLSAFSPNTPRDSHNTRPSRADAWEEIADLGYADWAAFNGLNLDTITRYKITADRLPAVAHLLGTYGRNVPRGTWDADALTNAPADRLTEALKQHKDPYVALASASDLGNLDRIRDCYAAGITSPDLIESGAPVDAIADIKAALKSLSDRDILAVIANDLTGAEAKAFGPIASLRYTCAELTTSTLKPSVIRGLSSAYPDRWDSPSPTMAQLEALHGAGYTGRAGIYTMTEAFGLRKNDARDIRTLVSIGKKITLDGLAAVSFIPRRDTYLPREATAIRTLIRGGITSKEAVEALCANLQGRSQTNDQPDREHGLTFHELLAAAVSARISPERIGVLSRAGIPLSRMKDFAKSGTEWADGAPFRAAVLATEERRAAFSRNAAPVGPWEFTEETFRG